MRRRVHPATLGLFTAVCLGACERSRPQAEVAQAAPAAGIDHPAPADPLPPPAPQRPAFLPSTHGLAFRNYFEGTPLPGFLEAVAGKVGTNLPDHYGLCGGMSLAAADFYLAGKPRPPATSPPKKGDPLYEYLRSRQTDSFGRGWTIVFKTIDWMALPDDGPGGLAELTALELQDALPRLAKGELTDLCMITQRKGEGQPWENHQVLAFSSESSSDACILHIYDSNRPGDDHVRLTLTPTPGSNGYRCEWEDGSGRKRPIRGFFVVPFEPRTPPPQLQDR